jgi:hypothetical protein
MVYLKFSKKVQFSPLFLQIIPIWSFNFLQFNFDIYIFLLSISNLRERERERWLDYDIKRESCLLRLLK